jgi:hypothetical protein
MSLITFRDRNTSGDPVGPVWYLQFDAVTVEEFTRDAVITQYPVETGAVLSDHYQPQPRRINLVGVVSDTPVGAWTNLENKQNAAAPPIMVERILPIQVKPDQNRIGRAGVPRPISTTVLPSRRLVRANVDRARLYIPKFAYTLQTVTGSEFTGSGVTRIKSFREILDGLMTSRTQVEVVMQDGLEYKNMFITSVTAPRLSGSGGAVRFAIDMQEVVLASAATTTAPQPAEAKHAKKKNSGRKAPKPVVKDKELARFIKNVAPIIRDAP